MPRALFQALLLFLLLIAPILAWRVLRSPAPSAPPATPAAAPAAVAPPRPDPVEAPPRSTPPPTRALAEPGWADSLEAARGSRDRFGGVRAIAAALQAMDPAAATARIEAYLRTGQDVATGLPWRLGPGGRLQSAPSLRVWLLDQWGELDPGAAAAWARSALADVGGSADEYALHLRNYAWGADEEPAAVRAFLAQRTRALLAYAPWRESPTPGFQEAFDVLVWAEAVEAVPELVALLAPGNPAALRHPSELVLERLVERAPQPTLAAIAENLDATAGAPRLRAGYFARADLAENAQAELVAAYLLDPRVAAEERAYFFRLLPNLNQSRSSNLLSRDRPLSQAETVARLRAAEVQVAAWQEDPRFASWATALADTHRRLREILAQPIAQLPAAAAPAG